MYAVDPDTEIQGKKINSKYLPQDNGSYLLTIVTYYLTSWPFKSSNIYTAPEGWQGTIREGSPLTVVAYDEEWVTFMTMASISGTLSWEKMAMSGLPVQINVRIPMRNHMWRDFIKSGAMRSG